MIFGIYFKLLRTCIQSLCTFQINNMPVDQISKHDQELKIIKDWLTKQPHLPSNVDDQLICRFLHTCNFSLEQTKALIDLFYTVRSQAPEIFSDRDPQSENIQQALKCVDMVPLPILTENKHKLFIYRLADTDPEMYQYTDIVKTFFMVSDVRMVTEKNIPEGEVPIFDMSGYSLRHLAKISLPIVKKYMMYTQEAHPIKLKQIHVINTPPFLDRCMVLVKPFMKNEVASLIHFHLPNSQTLFEYIPRELLPEEYGGQIGNLGKLKEELVKKLMDHRDFFRDESRWKVDESKRPAQSKHLSKSLNMQGTFRNLNLD